VKPELARPILFEASNFDEVFKKPAPVAAESKAPPPPLPPEAPPATMPAAAPSPAAGGKAFQFMDDAAGQSLRRKFRGIHLSFLTAILLGVVILALLALAFVGGMLLGRSWTR
jgi:hypothetical protein